MLIALLYFKREQLDFSFGQVVLTTQLLFSTGRTHKKSSEIQNSYVYVKAYYCRLPAKIQQHFVKKDISVITRLKNQLVRRCVTLNVRAMSLPMYGISLWNSLHVELTDIKTIRSFRQKYKSILINEYI
jgi:hypothetical protein